MKSLVSLTLVSGAIFLLAAVVAAQEKGKEVTLKGTLLCAKCTLGKTAECTTAIQVKEGDKTVTYYLDDKGAGEEHHEPICGGAKKEGTVVGTVHEKDGQKYIKPSKVTYAK
jgi:hypothetical protein